MSPNYQEIEGQLELLKNIDKVDRSELICSSRLVRVRKLVQFDFAAKTFDVVDAVIEQNGVLLNLILANAVLKTWPLETQNTSRLISDYTKKL